MYGYRENRYLLFLTENYVALDILKHYLSDVNALHQLDLAERKPEEMEPYVLFGSSFPKDKEYTQVTEIHTYNLARSITPSVIFMCRFVEISTRSKFVWRWAELLYY